MQLINLAVHSSVCENACCFLEGRSREERTCLERSFGNPKQNRLTRSFDLAFFTQAIIHLVKLDPVNLLTSKVRRITRVIDLYLLQHLANNHFDVLVIDAHTLQTVDILNFVDEVGSKFLHT